MISGIALRRDRMALWTIVAMTLALTCGMARAELSPTAWVLDLLAQVEQWQLTGPLDFLPDRGKGLNHRSVDRANPLRQMRASYVQTPIYFEPNVGQTATDVRFLARGPGYTLFLTNEETVLVLQAGNPPSAVIRTRLEGATPHPEASLEGLEKLPGISNYFLGNNPAKWRTNVPHYQRVRYPQVYPGIDLVYYGNPRQLEYDFIVAPSADPAAIQLAISGAERVRVNAEGDLVLTVPGGEVVQHAPRIYQMIDGRRQTVAGRYVLRDGGAGGASIANVATVDPVAEALRVGFEIAQYDRQQPLVIDPVLDLVYSSFLGGIKEDYGTSIAVDHNGYAYVTGGTMSSIDFPVEGGGGFQPNPIYKKLDAFVSKFDFDQSGAASLLCSTYLGGSWTVDEDDVGYAVAVDDNGFAYVAGVTESEDFPAMGFTNLPLMPGTFRGGKDAFITILNQQCGLVASTCWGGTKDEEGRGIAVHNSRVYVTGFTNSNFTALPGDEFPLENPFQPALLGGTDVFVSVLETSGAVRYSTYLGGLKDDKGAAIAVDGLGFIYITGSTASTNFPVTGLALDTTLGGSLDGFVAKIDPDWNRDGRYSLVYSTYLGGSSTDSGAGIAVDSNRYAYVTGATASSNFPVTINAAQSTYRGSGDAFVAKINPDPTLVAMNSLLHATYLGGSKADSGTGIVVIEPPADSIRTYITGETASPVTTSPTTTFPITPDAADATLGGVSDAFIAQLSDTGDAWVYVTYLGGMNGIDSGAGITANIDPSGTNIYVTGGTSANDFPFTTNAYYKINNNVKDAFVAKLQDLAFALTVKLIGSGEVTSNPPGIFCSTTTASCLKTWTVGTSVTLTASPVSGNQFVGWSGACSGAAPCTLNMNAAKSVTATFSATPTYTVTVSKAGAGNGTVAGGGNYMAGATVNLTANPATDSTFAGWSPRPCATSFTMPTNNLTCTATFNAATVVSSQSLVLCGDYNGDSKVDLIWSNSTTGQIYGMLLDGTVISQQGMIYQEPNTAWRIVHNGDLDGNGKDDLLWWNNQTGQVYLMPMNGLSTAGGAMIYQEPNTAWQIVAVGDLNGDGKADLVWWNHQTGQVYGMLMSGAARIQEALIHQEPNTDWRILAARDFTGDQQADLLWRNINTGEVYLMPMNGLSIVGGAMVHQVSNLAWSIVAVGDLSGDGKADLVWRNSQTGEVYGMLMNGSVISAQGVMYTEPNTAWQIVASGDYNGDSRTDLLWRNSTSGQVYEMPMNGLTVAGGAVIYQEANPVWQVNANVRKLD